MILVPAALAGDQIDDGSTTMPSAKSLLLLAVVGATSIAAAPPEWAAFGRPGTTPDRTVAITATEMAYAPNGLDVKQGETVRFLVTNRGQLAHEFVIGDLPFQHQHMAEMARMPDMKMDEANALDLRPGETKALIWQFTRAGKFIYACDIPGHADAGMMGRIEVR